MQYTVKCWLLAGYNSKFRSGLIKTGVCFLVEELEMVTMMMMKVTWRMHLLGRGGGGALVGLVFEQPKRLFAN